MHNQKFAAIFVSKRSTPMKMPLGHRGDSFDVQRSMCSVEKIVMVKKVQGMRRQSVSLSSPKGGEGRGEEALGFMGRLFHVRCSMFPPLCPLVKAPSVH